MLTFRPRRQSRRINLLPICSRFLTEMLMAKGESRDSHDANSGHFSEARGRKPVVCCEWGCREAMEIGAVKEE